MPHFRSAPLEQSSAYLLISHGSRDLRPDLAARSLARLVSKRLRQGDYRSANVAPTLPSPGQVTKTPPLQEQHTQRLAEMAAHRLQPLVGTATLELSPVPLHEQIRQFGQRSAAAGCDSLKLIPLFLLPGVHVMEDIPKEVAIARHDLDGRIAVDLYPHLGSHPDIVRLLAEPMQEHVSAARVLVSHGSRRAGGNQPVEAIAAQLGAVPAYWSTEPGLGAQVQALVEAGKQSIAILPYFLFAGGLTDAIAQQIDSLSQQLPHVEFHHAEPIGTSPGLASLILDLLQQESRSDI